MSINTLPCRPGRLAVGHTGVVACVLIWSLTMSTAAAAVNGAEVTHTGNELRIATRRWGMVLDPASGAIQTIRDCAAPGVLLRGASDL